MTEQLTEREALAGRIKTDARNVAVAESYSILHIGLGCDNDITRRTAASCAVRYVDALKLGDAELIEDALINLERIAEKWRPYA